MRTIPKKTAFTLAVLIIGALAAQTAMACDTPVYRYAMYKWRPAPYEIYFFHNAEPMDADLQVQKAIEALAEDQTKQTNIVYIPVNLTKDKELAGVPADVKEAWLKRKEPTTPHYMVVSPMGAQVFNGMLKKEDVASLIDSKSRLAIAKQLHDGKLGAFILLTGKDDEANSRAEAVLNEFAKDVAAGKLDLEPGTIDDFPNLQDKPPVEEKPKTMPQGIGIVKVARDDKNEQWLVRQLLEVEPDLKDAEFESKPMVFVVLGRGRTLPPFIGTGITKVNLTDVAHFISGPCSCTVQEQNPGVNLLFHYDWETASADMAEKFGSEEGNEKVFGAEEFFPDLIIPTISPDDQASQIDDPSTDPQQGKSTSEPETTDPVPDSPSQNGTKQTDNRATPEGNAPKTDLTDTSDGSRQVALSSNRTNLPANESSAEDNSHQSILLLGIGIGVAFILLFGATLIVLKPRK